MCKLIAAALIGIAGSIACPGTAGAQSKSPVAIIDASLNLKPHLATLKASGVAVVGRYLGRCPQWEGKRLVDNGARDDANSEISKILDAGLAVLSIYQYLSNHPRKFDGKWEDQNDRDANGVKLIKNLPVEDCSRPADVPHTVEQEAELDGKAAVAQAGKLGQPIGSAIYFGIDFDFDSGDRELTRKLTTYITLASRHVKAAGYQFGAYGSGNAHVMLAPLKHASGALRGKPLVDYFWLSAARGHRGSAGFLNSGNWHMLQTWTDTCWFTTRPNETCSTGLELDPNIQNPRFAATGIGFWKANEPYTVPAATTTAVAKAHRFICNGVALLRAAPAPDAGFASPGSCAAVIADCDNADNEPDVPSDLRPRACYSSVVRIGRTSGKFIEVDHKGCGAPVGWTRLENVTAAFAGRPEYIANRAARRAAVCR